MSQDKTSTGYETRELAPYASHGPASRGRLHAEADEGAGAHTPLVAEGDIQEVWHEEVGQAPGLSQGPDAGPSEWQEASDPFQ